MFRSVGLVLARHFELVILAFGPNSFRVDLFHILDESINTY